MHEHREKQCSIETEGAFREGNGPGDTRPSNGVGRRIPEDFRNEHLQPASAVRSVARGPSTVLIASLNCGSNLFLIPFSHGQALFGGLFGPSDLFSTTHIFGIFFTTCSSIRWYFDNCLHIQPRFVDFFLHPASFVRLFLEFDDILMTWKNTGPRGVSGTDHPDPPNP